MATTLDGVVTSWNAGAEALFGYSPEEMTGRHVSVLIPSDRADELVPILGQIRRGRRVHPFETRRVRKDGSLVDVSLSLSPIHDRTGAIIGAASVARDVTERNWAEAERRTAEAGLRQAERMESRVPARGRDGQRIQHPAQRDHGLCGVGGRRDRR